MKLLSIQEKIIKEKSFEKEELKLKEIEELTKKINN
jgi:hypothetical protein